MQLPPGLNKLPESRAATTAVGALGSPIERRRSGCEADAVGHFDLRFAAGRFFAAVLEPDFLAADFLDVDFFDADLLDDDFLDGDFCAADFLVDDFFAGFLADFFAVFFPDFFAADFLGGTFAPARRASDSPIAIACLRLFTFLPERPLSNLPVFRSCITFLTFDCAFFPYFGMLFSYRWPGRAGIGTPPVCVLQCKRRSIDAINQDALAPKTRDEHFGVTFGNNRPFGVGRFRRCQNRGKGAPGRATRMAELNHTIGWCRDRQASATFVAGRIRERQLTYWADPGQRRAGQINRNDGGRGLYFEGPDGHVLEIITRPYGSGG